MTSTRNKVVKLAQSYVGAKQGSDKHKDLVDTFNKEKPNGEVGNYSCAWCAITWTAIQLKAGNTQKSVPMSYNCGTLVDQAKKLKIWVEDDAYVPKPADGIIYNWDDSGKGDCSSGASHVGIVESVADGYITVIEGNKGTTKMCGRRNIKVNSRYIRGFIAPKYSLTKAEKLGAEANRIAWPKGTDEKKWAYKTGAPTSKCKTDMIARGYSSKIEFSDCGYFVNTIIYHALGKKVKSIGKPSEAFDKVDGFKVVKSTKSIKSGSLKKYDIVRYKRISNGKMVQHVGMYMGDGYFAEAGRGTRFGVIHKTKKFYSKNLKQIQILRVEEK